MSNRPFVHLHCHSHYSLLDGAGTIDKLVARAKALGMNALAITDHGNLHGALQHYTACKAAGINPIVGYEAYIAPGRRTERQASSSKEASYHLTLLAMNRTGFKNLVKMASAAYLEGFHYKPRIDKELLEAHHEGIICLSGCVSSEFSRAVLRGHGGSDEWAEARRVSEWFSKLFGDRYFIEVMNNGVEIQRLQLEGSVDIARRVGLPLVATSDTHYVEQGDHTTQDVMLCINTGRFRTDTNRMRMDGDQYFLRSPEEMYAHFPTLTDAVARSQEIADRVDLDLELGRRHFPVFPLPEVENQTGPPDADEYLRQLCYQGLRERYEGNEKRLRGAELSQEIVDRLERELGVIRKLGFSNYFLIVWDFVRHARVIGVPATARGSGVGAIVCYALYLSHVCPIEYDLLFERFLDENRLEAPDIDIDFCQELRPAIIQYVKDKYGSENVAQIGTFGTLKARAAIKDVGRALSIPLARVNQVTAMVPEDPKITLDKALKMSEELSSLYSSDVDMREVIDFARKIEGLARNIGTHAAAVVIADRPLTEYVPLCRVPGKEDVITQWSMNDVEAAGLLKMDFLGLRNLTILRKTIDLIRETTGETVDPLKFPLEDKETFALLCRGETKGVFQLEGGGIRDLLTKMKPDHFRDIIATLALYRPGPLEGGMVETYVNVKHGREQPVYKHEILRGILEETNSVMVYQEQVMRILNRLGGIPLANAYTCIKAISKKKESLIAQNAEQFLKGSVENGLAKIDASEIWEMILKFAGYGFNKSHSTAYALVAYQTAYLKAHYKTQFMAALLSGDIPGRNFKRKDLLCEHMEDCSRMGIEVVPPHVNTSASEFSVAGERIHFGLSAIKGCGGAAADSIVKARKENGPFKSLFDFCERVDPHGCGRAAIEMLVKAGALDGLGGDRAQLAAAIDKAVQAGSAALADKKVGQGSLFGGDDEGPAQVTTQDLPAATPWTDKEIAQAEKEVLGFYLSSHPLAEQAKILLAFSTHTTDRLQDVPDRQEILMGGMISSIKTAHTKNGRPDQPSKYANFDLEDPQGMIRCIQWPRDYAQYGDKIVADSIVFARGVLDRRGGDEPNLIVSEVIPLEEAEAKFAGGIRIELTETPETLAVLPTIREVLRMYPGEHGVSLVIKLTDGPRVKLKTGMRVELGQDLRRRVEDLLGAGCLKVIARAFTPSPASRGPRGRGAGGGAGGYSGRSNQGAVPAKAGRA